MKIIYFLLVFVTTFSSCVANPLTVVIFGAMGDLSSRKLYPAVFNLNKEEALPADFQVMGIGRHEVEEKEFHESIYEALKKFSRNQPTEGEWDSFSSHLSYRKMDDSEYQILVDFLNQRGGDVLFFLATESSSFRTIIQLLSQHGLLQQKEGFSRVIIEKPFGEDLDSALALQAHIFQFLEEDQIYRMDHYLGKEGVFKLAKYRLEDAPHENYLNRHYVDHIQLTLSETIGIGTRANFYEKTGHLRDVIQNHVMQVVAIAMMDQPLQKDQKQILAEKAKVLDAIRPLAPDDAIRGQYTAGMIKDERVVGYREESDVPANSLIETFVQARLFIDNERWEGVPFYIRSGKRLPEQLTQIKYFFKDNPLNLEAVTVVIQPHPRILVAQNGYTLPFLIDLDPALERREGYENQLLAAIHGDKTGFVAIEELLASWALLTPLLNHWSQEQDLPFYKAGSWAPIEAEEQLKEEGIEWRI